MLIIRTIEGEKGILKITASSKGIVPAVTTLKSN